MYKQFSESLSLSQMIYIVWVVHFEYTCECSPNFQKGGEKNDDQNILSNYLQS